MNDDLARLQRVWRSLGRDDPLWAVLSQPGKQGRRWDEAEFLATGRADIETQLQALSVYGLPSRRGVALDFGCGAGRLSRALADHFEQVIGLDVSATMIEAARRINADRAHVRFQENPSPRLEHIADRSVDLVYSTMTLQHIPTALAAGYVAEFMRVLAPGGVAAFQFVAGPDRSSRRGRLYAQLPNRWLNPLRRLLWRRWSVFEMHVLPESLLQERLDAEPGVRRVAALDDGAAGRGWQGRRWYLTRDA